MIKRTIAQPKAEERQQQQQQQHIEIRFKPEDIREELIGAVKLWKDNPRKNDAAVPKLAKIIAAHGQRTPIVAWRRDKVVYKGNTTLKAMQSLGAKTISVLWADFPSEQAAIAYGIADNKSSEYAEWNDEILGRLLEAPELKALPTGFTERELAEIVAKQHSRAGVPYSVISKCARILPPISPDIYNYAQHKSGKLCMTDLEVFIEFDITSLLPASCMLSREYIAKGLPVENCVSQNHPSDDFIEHPARPKSAAVACTNIYGIGTLCKYISSNAARSSLIYVYASVADKLLFATDGARAIYRKEISIDQDLALPETFCNILAVLQHDAALYSDGAYLYAEGKGYRVACKYNAAEKLPTFSKVVPRDYVKQYAYDIAAIPVEDILQTSVSERGEATLNGNAITVHRLKGNPVEFVLPAAIAPEDSRSVNIRFMLEVMQDVGSGEVCYSEALNRPIVFRGNQFSGLVMPLRLSADVSTQPAIKFEHAESAGSNALTYRLDPGGIIGTVELGVACAPSSAMRDLFGAGNGKYVSGTWEYFGGKLKAILI